MRRKLISTRQPLSLIGLTCFSLNCCIVIAAMSTCLALAWVVLGFGTSFVVKGVEASVPGNPDVSPSLQEVLNKAHQGPLYTYPTSFTQGIIPVRRSILTNSRARIYFDNKIGFTETYSFS